MRVISHPVLEDMQGAKWVEITVDGRKIVARQGESIAAALMAEGIRTMRYTPVRSEPRGVFCGIGQCSDCMVTVNGVPNVRACITPVEEGMVVETGTVQHRG
ncbi:MAG: (2Fe-2S)-binding protein [Firmicutes bacterium]|nr:(2Fe-2S)-binding protein [Candidatus Fermentithermobacillaceae bacterium]HON86756.1 (2Fe-2S)-binding protein [Bacillota bacterium]HOV65320.1 (2Fe-2S)-binding protein [Bacillota bacterium]HRC52893.1 (2Fe-2S)-binding protein [Bacillota bacterium]